MKQVCKRLLALLLSLLLLGGAMSVAGAAFDPVGDGGETLTMAMKFFRLDDQNNWIETTRAKPGEALLLRFYAATNYATNNFDLGFAYDRQFFVNNLATGGPDAVFSVNPALPMLEDYMFTYPAEADKANNAKLRRLLADGRLTQEALEANDFMIGFVEWAPDAVNAALPADTWIFELDNFSVAENDYVRTPGQTGVLEVPAALGLDASAGGTGLYSFPKGEPGAEPVANAMPGNGWMPAVTSTPAQISVFSKLILDANGGSFGTQTTHALTGVIGEQVTGLAEMDGLPTREGWQFAGFARTQDGAALSDAELAALTYDYEDQTLYAQWTPAPVLYTYDAGEGAFADGEKTREVSYKMGDVPAAPAETPAKPGCRFLDWDNDLPATVTGPMTFTALYEPLPCTISFLDADGGDLGAITVDGGSQIDVLDLPEGYKPTGWTDAAGNAVTFPYTVTGDLTLIAPENGNVYNAYFYVNDALYATTQAAYEEPINLPADPVVRGYTFLMWDPDPDGVQDTEELRFDAVLEENTDVFTVYYYYNNAPAGVTDPDPAEGLCTGDAIPLPQHPDAPGYTVTDWALTDENGPMSAAVMGASDVYATASWTAIPYTVTYVYSGEVPAGAQAPAPVTATIGDEIALPEITAPEGYVFEGWTLSGDADGRVGAQDATVTGVWSRETFRVTYAFDGQVPDQFDRPADYDGYTGDPVVLPEIAAPAGYTFAGWTLVNDDNGKIGRKPVTAVGSWRIHTHTATFLDDAGTPVASDTYAYGAPVPAPEAPAKLGFLFVDWYSETAGVWTEATVMGDADVTFTARYAEHAYTVTYLANDETVATQTVPAGAQAAAPDYTAPAGYGLQYWADAAGEAVTFPFTPAGDVTLTAVLGRAVDGLFYREHVPGEVEITGLEFGRTAAEIPAQINNKPVTAIAAGAFRDNAGLTAVSIPKSVAQIGADAFAGCDALAQADYAGTQTDFDAVALGSGNDPLLAVLRCHVHAYTATVVREATCKQTGERLWVCDCGDRYTEEIPLAAHTGGYWVLNLDRGMKEEICTVCGAVLASEPYEEPPVEQPTPGVKILRNPGTVQLPYRYSLVLKAEATDLGAGQAIAWYLNDELQRIDSVGLALSEIKLSELREGVTVTAKVVDAQTGVPAVDEAGNEIADREIVEVKNGFFARLIAFFRALFGRLRIVEQVFQDVI